MGRKLANAAGTGLDVWAMLAGAGIVVGTGGIGGLVLLAWRGLRAAKTVAHVASIVRPQQSSPTPPVAHPVTQPIEQRRPFVVPAVPPAWDGKLPPHDVRFVNVPNDFRKESVDWALEQFARTEPRLRNAAGKFKSLINQHLSASGHARPEELHE